MSFGIDIKHCPRRQLQVLTKEPDNLSMYLSGLDCIVTDISINSSYFCDIDTSITKAQTKFSKLCRAIALCQNSANHAASLPGEILCQIFEDACQAYPPDATAHSGSISHAASAYRLTRQAIVSTCTHWRGIGLSCSLLWGTIVIGRTPDFSSISSIPNLSFLPLELQRSQARSLRIFLYLDTLEDLVECVAPTLAPLMHRVGLASVAYPPELRIVDDIVPAIQHQNLKALSIEANAEGYAPSDQHQLSSPFCLSSHPSLLRLRLCLHQPLRIEKGLASRDSSLRELTLIGSIDTLGLLVIVAECVQLERFYWSNEHNRDTDAPMPLHGILLPNLYPLFLAGTVPLSTLPLWRGPRLAQLACIPWNGTLAMLNNAVSHPLQVLMATHQYTNLRHFCIGSHPSTVDNAIVQFLHSHPSIEGVEFTSKHLTSAIMDGLTAYLENGEELRLPNLRDIWTIYDRRPNVQGVYETSIEEGFVRRRARAGQQPATLHLHTIPHVLYLDEERLYWPTEAASAVETLIERSGGRVVAGKCQLGWDWYTDM